MARYSPPQAYWYLRRRQRKRLAAIAAPPDTSAHAAVSQTLGALTQVAAGTLTPLPDPFTWNPADVSSNAVLSTDNRDWLLPTAGSFNSGRAIISKSTGKWYVEIFTIEAGSAAPGAGIGFGQSDFDLTQFPGATPTGGMLYFGSPGFQPAAGDAVTPVTAPDAPGLATGDVHMMAFDYDAGKSWVGKNGTWCPTMDPVTENNPWYTWTPGGSWYVAVTSTPPSNTTFRLLSTTSFAPPTGYSVLNA